MGRCTPRPVTKPPSATCPSCSLANDNVFGDDQGASQLATASGDVRGGYAVSLTVGVDTTAASGGQNPGDGRPSGAPDGQPPSGPPAGGAPTPGSS